MNLSFQGVVHSFLSIQSQVEGMQSAWAWSPSDVILHSLPLHHIHGVVNALLTPLYTGATCVMLPQFDAHQVSYLTERKILNFQRGTRAQLGGGTGDMIPPTYFPHGGKLCFVPPTSF